MRRVIVFLMAAMALAAAVIAVFILTLDADTLRPLLIEGIESSTGSKAELDGLDIAWRGGVALVVRGLRITSPGNSTGVPDLAVEKADLILELRPLLRKEIEVSSISLEKPRINIIKTAGGRISVKGIDPKKTGKALSVPEGPQASAPALPVFRIGAVTITDGVIRYADNTAKGRTIDMTVGKVDVSVKDISSSSTMRFKAAMAFLSKERNVSLSGNVAGLFGNKVTISGLSARADLDLSGNKDISKTIPALKKTGIREIRGGQLSLDIDELKFEGGKLMGLDINARVTGAEAVMEGMKAPVENIGVNISSDMRTADIKEFSAEIAGAVISARGAVSGLGVSLRSVMKIDADIPDLGALLKAYGREPGKIKGELKFSSDMESAVSKDRDVHTVVLKGGEIRYRVATPDGEENVPFERVDAKIERSISRGVTDFSADMAVFSREKNAGISGKIRRLSGNKAGVTEIKDLSAKLDLAGVDYAELAENVPIAAGLGFSEGTRGIAEITVPRIELGPDSAGFPDTGLKITKGRLITGRMRTPLENVRADINIVGGAASRLKINAAGADMAGAGFTLSGTVTDFLKGKSADIKFSASIPKLTSFIKKTTGKDEALDGALSVVFEGVFRGFTWEEISGSLTGSGILELKGGVITGTNFARDTLEKITLFPGVLAAVEKNLSSGAKEILARDDTSLKPISAPYKAEKGVLSFDKLNVSSDLISIDSDITADLSGALAGRGTIKFREDVTGAMLSGFAQFEFLKNESGLIEFPIKYTTDDKGIKISPDIPFITSKVIGGRGKELIDGLLEKMIN